MIRGLALLIAATALLESACGQGDELWFDGDFSAATSIARQNGSLVMLAFETSWCTWCERLDRETFADPQVRAALEGVVALKLDAERGGKSLAARYGVDSYPTVVFTDGDGVEIDRILGYLPPGEFAAESRRIRGGDTLLACLRRLSANPADAEAIETAVAGLLEHSDAEGAITRIEAFRQAAGDEHRAVCDQLMLRARMALHSRLYRQAVALHLDLRSGELAVPDADGTRSLHELIAGGFRALDADTRAELLQRARRDDAAVVIGGVDPSGLPPELAFELAGIAYRGDRCDIAAAAYGRWFEAAGAASDAADLRTASSQLYRCRESLETAVVMARRARDLEPSARSADTLARLLYATGTVGEAIALQRLAVDGADAAESEGYREALRRMEAGEELGDVPGFEPLLRSAEPAERLAPMP
jgi:thioredoxin-related protein